MSFKAHAVFQLNAPALTAHRSSQESLGHTPSFKVPARRYPAELTPAQARRLKLNLHAKRYVVHAASARR